MVIFSTSGKSIWCADHDLTPSPWVHVRGVTFSALSPAALPNTRVDWRSANVAQLSFTQSLDFDGPLAPNSVWSEAVSAFSQAELHNLREKRLWAVNVESVPLEELNRSILRIKQPVILGHGYCGLSHLFAQKHNCWLTFHESLTVLWKGTLTLRGTADIVEMTVTGAVELVTRNESGKARSREKSPSAIMTIRHIFYRK